MLKEWIGALRQRAAELIGPYSRQIAQRLDPYAQQARVWYRKLEPRERLLVRVLGGVAAVFLAYHLVYLTLADLSSGLENRVAERQTDVVQVQRLAALHAQVQRELKAAEHNTVPQAKDFSLFSVLEGSLTASVGRDKIGSITPSADRKAAAGFTQYSVELKLANLSLAQLVDALYGITTIAQPVGVESIRIQRRMQDPHSYDVDLTCVALAKNG